MAAVLQSLSDELVAIVEVASPAIVRVEGRRRIPATGIVWSADGVILTAHHVVTRDDNIGVGLSGDESMPAELVGRDPTTDLAVLHIATNTAATDLSPAEWAASDELQTGQLVLAMGRPGRTVQATLGVVSAVGKSWRTPAGGQIDRYVQTDVVMYPGFSGGPLVGAGGLFLGLNTSALLRGMSITVPANTLHGVIESLLAHGSVRRGYLGVGAQPVRLPDDLAVGLKQETALLLVNVEPGSPAAAGGLLMGDTIVSFDGEPVRHMDDLHALLSGDRIGRAVPVQIIRGGEQREFEVTVGMRT
jgi:S1-C subfamily serine protease